MRSRPKSWLIVCLGPNQQGCKQFLRCDFRNSKVLLKYRRIGKAYAISVERAFHKKWLWSVVNGCKLLPGSTYWKLKFNLDFFAIKLPYLATFKVTDTFIKRSRENGGHGHGYYTHITVSG